jgi:hypothetical protein
MTITAFAFGFMFTLVFSLPADWAWRRGGMAITAMASLVNVAAFFAAVILAGILGLYTGALAAAALVVGIVLAGMAGDATATALWGWARFRTW